MSLSAPTPKLQAAKLDVDVLCEEAMRQTGLSSFGPDTSFLEPLSVLLESLSTEARLHKLGRFIYWAWMLRLLRNRLFIERDRSSNPRGFETRVARPIFIIGMPRTGTTLLHRALALHPELRAPMLWELMHPSVGNVPEAKVEQMRRALAKETISRIVSLSPAMRSAHSMEVDSPEECFWLLEHTFIDPVHELSAHVPGYSAWLRGHCNDPATYEYHALLLGMIAGPHAVPRWVLKAPRHLGSLPALLAVYPDACIVQTHRAPLEALSSTCSLARHTRSLYSAHSDNAQLGSEWLERLETNLRAFHERRQRAPRAQFIDVAYSELVADTPATIDRICRHAGLTPSEAVSERVRGWLTQQRPSRRQVHEYSPAEFGLQPAQVAERFAWYAAEYPC